MFSGLFINKHINCLYNGVNIYLWNVMPGKFEVFKDRKKAWRFRLKSPNGKIISASEGYDSKQKCLNGIRSIIENAADSVIVVLEADKRLKDYRENKGR